jgi:hypothetical protein
LVAKKGQFQSRMPLGIRREVAKATLQQRPATNEVSRRMMVKGNRDLDQTLEKFAFWRVSLPPDILQRLVGFKELGGVEEPDALMKKTIQVTLGKLVHDRRFDGWHDEGRKRETTRISGKPRAFPASQSS